MIQSQELILLFVGVLLAASLVVFTLGSQVTTATGEASSVASQVNTRAMSSYEIVQVYEKNIYIRGISGRLDVNNIVVTVNGAPQSITVTFLRDNENPGLLDPNDLVVITLPVTIATGDCVMVDIDGVGASWGVCG